MSPCTGEAHPSRASPEESQDFRDLSPNPGAHREHKHDAHQSHGRESDPSCSPPSNPTGAGLHEGGGGFLGKGASEKPAPWGRGSRGVPANCWEMTLGDWNPTSSGSKTLCPHSHLPSVGTCPSHAAPQPTLLRPRTPLAAGPAPWPCQGHRLRKARWGWRIAAARQQVPSPQGSRKGLPHPWGVIPGQPLPPAPALLPPTEPGDTINQVTGRGFCFSLF